MNFGTIALSNLNKLPADSPRSVRLHECSKIIRTLVDDLPNECTQMLARRIRVLLNSVISDPDVSTEEQVRGSNLLSDLRTVDPRQRRIVEQRDTKTRRAEQEAESGVALPSGDYDPGLWYIERPEPDDEKKFQKIVEKFRHNPDATFFNSASVENIRAMVQPPCYHFGFNAEGLLRYSEAIRGPYTHDGELTQGGRCKAKILLCLDHLIAGTLDQVPVEPPESLTPLMRELLGRD